MHRVKVLTIIILTILIISLTPKPSISGAYSSVGIGRREPIPNDLPWYPLLVFGDNRPDNSGEVEFNPVTYHIRDEMATINPIAVIGVGDHVWNGYIDQIQHFIETFKNVPNLWVVAGNHEWNNLPYVSSKNREGVTYWRTHVAPDLYYKDDIPGWRIVFLNLRYGYEDWDNMENWIKTKAFNTERKLITAFHEPVYPDREASKAIRGVQDKLIPLLDQYKPSIVLQGHIHCYDEGYKYGTLYIITGGGGAPKCKRYPYHYILLILKPNGEYYYKPISATDGVITVSKTENVGNNIITYSFIIKNTKEDIYGNRINKLPVRISFEIGDTTYNLVYPATYGYTHITIRFFQNNETLTINTDDKAIDLEYKPYLYTYEGKIWIINETYTKIILSVNTPPTTTAENTTTTGNTVNNPEPTTTTTASASTTATTTTTTTGPAGNAQGEIGESNAVNNNGDKTVYDIVYMTIILLSLIIVVEGIIYIRKKK